MRHNPNESDAASDRIDKLAVDVDGAVPETSQLNSELLIALGAAMERNERVQERFRNAVVRRLARLEARARVLQLSRIVDWLPGGPVDTAVEREAACEAMVSELSEELERKMFKEISVGRDKRGEANAPRGRRRNWSGWEI